MAILYWII